MPESAIQDYRVATEPYYLPVGREVALFEAAHSARLPVILKGPTGCGKTRFVEHMAWRLERPLITVACPRMLVSTLDVSTRLPEMCFTMFDVSVSDADVLTSTLDVSTSDADVWLNVPEVSLRDPSMEPREPSIVFRLWMIVSAWLGIGLSAVSMLVRVSFTWAMC